MNRKMIIAHRGAREIEHENTIPAFLKAIELKADMIELDVRKSKDNQFIVFHDESISNNFINNLTFSEINTLAGKNNFTVPKLSEVLDLCRNKIKLDIELKETGYEKELAAFILKNFNIEDFIITSFNDNSIKLIKEFFPEIKTGLLLADDKPFPKNLPDIFPGKRLKYTSADYVLPAKNLLKFCLLLRSKKPVIVWTVNDIKSFRRLIRSKKIAGIVTDQPDKFI